MKTKGAARERTWGRAPPSWHPTLAHAIPPGIDVRGKKTCERRIRHLLAYMVVTAAVCHEAIGPYVPCAAVGSEKNKATALLMFAVVRSVVSLLAKGSCADSTVRN